MGGGAAGGTGAGAALAGAAVPASDGVPATGGGTSDEGAALVGGAAGAGDETAASADDEVSEESVLDVSSVPVPHADNAVASPTTASIRGPRMRPIVVRRRSIVGDLMTPPGIGGRAPRHSRSGKGSGAPPLFGAARRCGARHKLAR